MPFAFCLFASAEHRRYLYESSTFFSSGEQEIRPCDPWWPPLENFLRPLYCRHQPGISWPASRFPCFFRCTASSPLDTQWFCYRAASSNAIQNSSPWCWTLQNHWNSPRCTPQRNATWPVPGVTSWMWDTPYHWASVKAADFSYPTNDLQHTHWECPVWSNTHPRGKPVGTFRDRARTSWSSLLGKAQQASCTSEQLGTSC